MRKHKGRPKKTLLEITKRYLGALNLTRDSVAQSPKDPFRWSQIVGTLWLVVVVVDDDGDGVTLALVVIVII